MYCSVSPTFIGQFFFFFFLYRASMLAPVLARTVLGKSPGVGVTWCLVIVTLGYRCKS